MWPPQVVERAKAFMEGFENMLSSLTSRRASTSQEPLVASQPLSADYKLDVMLDWCKSVALGRMQHGPLLAHAKTKCGGIVMHPSGRHLVPKERHNVWPKYPWEAHGHDGVLLIRKCLVQHNCVAQGHIACGRIASSGPCLLTNGAESVVAA